MKIECKCGNYIVDQTDMLRNKAILIADQDWFDFLESVKETGHDDLELSRKLYECDECGRLYIYDQNGGLNCFLPEDESHNILASMDGDNWKRSLFGGWWKASTAIRTQKGYVECEGEDTYESTEWSDIKKVYFEMFERLKDENRLRSALLRMDGENIHSWKYNKDA